MRTFVRSHRLLDFLFFRILVARSSALSIPRPMPAKECIVMPPMLQAAMPADWSPQIAQTGVKVLGGRISEFEHKDYL